MIKSNHRAKFRFTQLQSFYAVSNDSLFIFVADREVRDNFETRRYPENRGTIDQELFAGINL